ncbi:DUF167 domain-containing protein [Oxyplasma meridianum]|uniref:DUF167 domain-containing protein n=1 Tax=Oxyplasma meridianum TaxID=3073602 RepID=A0AAX4NG72_9ARCH
MKSINVKVSHGKGGISEEEGFIRVHTMEPRENNRANIDVKRQISKYYQVPFTCIRIISGQRSKNKIVEIDL